VVHRQTLTIEELFKSHGHGVKNSAYQQVAAELDVSPKQARNWYQKWGEKSEDGGTDAP
jgi:transposase-like protein